jgi:hypothetical protein
VASAPAKKLVARPPAKRVNESKPEESDDEEEEAQEEEDMLSMYDSEVVHAAFIAKYDTASSTDLERFRGMICLDVHQTGWNHDVCRWWVLVDMAQFEAIQKMTDENCKWVEDGWGEPLRAPVPIVSDDTDGWGEGKSALVSIARVIDDPAAIAQLVHKNKHVKGLFATAERSIFARFLRKSLGGSRTAVDSASSSSAPVSAPSASSI